MWFKQIQIFQLMDAIAYTPEKIAQQLEPLAFTSCLPSMPASIGWTSPLDVDNAPLIHAMNGYMMICMQVEEKILPATVIRQELNDKVKLIEATDDRKIRSKEKLSLKDEIVITLLPRAFTKLSKVYGYIDVKNKWLVLGTTNAKRTEEFLSLFKKTIAENVRPFEINKVSPVMTQWLKSQSYPKEFSVEKACMLQDPDQQNRIIRCQQQDLFAGSIQSLLKDGCVVKQLAVCWQDRLNFMLAEDFTIRGVQYQEDILQAAKEIDSESEQQRFDADFFIMTETLGAMFRDLLGLFVRAVEVEISAA